MNLTPEQQELGRRNFLRALAGTPALAALAAGAQVKGPVRGGPVRLGFVGLGGQGRVLLEQTDPAYGEVRALSDVNPAQLAKADLVLAKTKRPPARHYAEWTEMLQKEDLEGVVIAAPLWLHADITVACLEAGKHVLCEKMMAWDVAGCERMKAAAEKAGRVLEIGYQRAYNPVYQAAHDGIVKAGLLGDMYHARLVWHRNQNWKRKADPPSADYDPSRWGYPTFDHLVNWRLFWKYSKGLFAELASHQVNVVNWFFGAVPEAVIASGGLYRFPEGREVYDHVYATFEYPQGRTATFSSIESNAFEHYYEMYLGTKGTLILRGETDAFLFEEGRRDAPPTAIDVALKGSGPALEASESRAADAAAAGAAPKGAAPGRIERVAPYRLEVSAFCAAVRTGRPLRCGPERALHSARACIRGNEAVATKTRLTI
ncbi:MAG TPA: Gfo/Idh/MocA family oxidoreductase [Vicinamibacteria bacterium]|nr:Gfo/Idh/MocA family oxidoreductase [Vicinamibacteria bacterium]